MQVAKWGNSLAVRLPAALVEVREFGVSRKPGREELLRRLRTLRGRLPADFKFDRDEANAR
jgi:antitoxin MazE